MSADRPPATGPGEVVHIAGPEVQVGPRLRQRCSWCGACLADYDLRNLSFAVAAEDPDKPGPVPTDQKPAMWEPGALVAVYGERTGRARSGLLVGYVVAHEDGAAVPANCCAVVDADMTV